MSVAHIKEEILHLTSTDRREVELFLRDLAQEESPPASETAQPSRRERFEAAKSHLFNNYGDLLQKLAQ